MILPAWYCRHRRLGREGVCSTAEAWPLLKPPPFRAEVINIGPGTTPDAPCQRHGFNTCRIGGRFDLGTSLSLSLEAERSNSNAGAPKHGLALRGALRW